MGDFILLKDGSLMTAISQDEGKTFIHRRNIARDPEDDFGYQCIEFLGKRYSRYWLSLP